MERRLHRLTANDPESWALLPKALDRVLRFGAEYPVETDAAQLVQAAKAHFVAETNRLGLWVLVEDGALAGHLLAFMNEATPPVAFVSQLEFDGAVDDSVKQAGLAALHTWAAEWGAPHLEMWTWHPPRLWHRYGFTAHRTIMRSPVRL